MKTLKFGKVLFLGLAVLFASCQSDNQEPEPETPLLKSVKAQGGFGVEFKYDNNKRLNQFILGLPGTLETTTYNLTYSNDKLSSIAETNGSNKNTFTYDANGKISSMTVYDGDQPYLRTDYTYNAAGNITTAKTYAIHLTPERLASTTDFTYDNQNQLKDFTISTPSGVDSGFKTIFTITGYETTEFDLNFAGLSNLFGGVEFPVLKTLKKLPKEIKVETETPNGPGSRTLQSRTTFNYTKTAQWNLIDKVDVSVTTASSTNGLTFDFEY